MHDTEPCVPSTSVELLRWPDDQARRDELAARGVSRLLLLRPGSWPPAIAEDEDCMFVPADERDVSVRLHQLAQRAAARRRVPYITNGVVLHHAARTVIVSEGQAAMLRPLIDRFGHLVAWDELYHHMWPDGPASGRSAVSRVARLRSRLRPVGLTVTTVRTRGVVLDHTDDMITADLSGTNEEH